MGYKTSFNCRLFGFINVVEDFLTLVKYDFHFNNLSLLYFSLNVSYFLMVYFIMTFNVTWLENIDCLLAN